MNYVDIAFKSPNVLSYCTGFRGLERGIERATGPIRTAAIVEIEAFIIENLLAGMEAGVLVPAPIWPNIKTFDARPFRGKVHGIIGGYPCQPFSNAGSRKGTDDPRHLYPYLGRDIKAAGPVWCFFENVGGHLSLGFDTVYKSLSDMGYAVEAGLFTAAEAGAPHKRERLFILAIRKDFLADTGLQRSAQRQKSAARAEQCGEELDNAQRLRWEQGRQTDREYVGHLTSAANEHSDELAHTNSERHIHRQPGQHPTEGGQHAQCDTTSESENGTMAHAGQFYVQRDESEFPNKENREEQGGRSLRPQGGVCCWPARPGEPQHEWEEPRTVITEHAARLLGGYGKKYPEAFQRWQIDQVAFDGFAGTIKSGLGSTVNGYDFREDLLRAYGNSVVEQAAEIAFRTLLHTHFSK